MRLRVKICPSCKGLNPCEHNKCFYCDYVFEGNEEGASDKTMRLNAKTANPTDEEILRQIKLITSASVPSKYSTEQIKFLFKHIMFGLFIIIIGVIAFFSFFSYARSDAIIPGATVLFFIGGIGGMLGGLGYIIFRLWKFISGPQMKSPEETLNTFYANGVLNDFIANFGGAWECLSPGAKESFKTLKDFKDYWKELFRYFRENVPTLLGASLDNSLVKDVKDEISSNWNLTYSYAVKNIEFTNKTDESCIINFDFEVKQSKIATVKTGVSKETEVEILDGSIIVPQKTALVKSNNMWFLTSSTLDLPVKDAAIRPQNSIIPDSSGRP